MAKHGFLQKALPFLGAAAAVAAPFVGPALFGAGEAATAGGEAAAVGGEAAAAGAGETAITAGDALATDFTGGLGAAGAAGAPTAAEVAGATSAGIGGGFPSAGTLLGTVPPVVNAASSLLGGGGGEFAPLGQSQANLPSEVFSMSSTGSDAPTVATGSPVAGLSGLGGGVGGGDIPYDAYASDPNTDNQRTVNQEAIDAATSPAATGGSGGGVGGTIANIGDYIAKNPGLPLAGGGLLAATLMNRGAIPGAGPIQTHANQLSGEAGQLMAQATQNINAPVTGALPVGTHAAIDQAANAAKAQIRSSFAAMGINPSSTMAAEQLAQVDQEAAVQKFNAAKGLAQIGLNEVTGAQTAESMAGQDLTQLMNAKIKQDEALQLALARFAGGLAGPALRSSAQPQDSAA